MASNVDSQSYEFANLGKLDNVYTMFLLGNHTKTQNVYRSYRFLKIIFVKTCNNINSFIHLRISLK